MSSGGVLVRRPLDAATIAHALRGARLGTHVVACPSVASTMDAAAALAAAGTPDGAVVLADVQTAGRGRHGRAWLAPPGTALMLSIVLRPPVPPDRLPQALMAVALGALEAIAGRLPADAPLGLKWPNDIVVGDRKIAGLLAETTWRGSDRPVVIVGLGLNVSQARAALPDGAVSLRLAGARDLARTATTPPSAPVTSNAPSAPTPVACPSATTAPLTASRTMTQRPSVERRADQRGTRSTPASTSA